MGKSAKNSGALPFIERESFGKRLARNYKEHKVYYWLAVPIIAYYIIFHYLPMFGVVIAFQNYRPAKGLLGSSWVGLKHFKAFFDSIYAGRLIKNTLMINLLLLIFSFPAPIILALLLNEVKAKHFKKTVQTISYMPHFISMVVICGLLVDFCSSTGIITSITTLFGAQRDNLLNRPELFRTIYVSSDIWQSIGWGSIIYLATLSGTDPSLYEAAAIDGAGRFQQVIHVTLPTLVPLIMLQLIMRMGQMMNVGYEKIILLSNGLTYDTADVISSYVYRRGLQTGDFSFGVAVSLFNSACNIVLLVLANTLSGKLTHESMW
ncbi:MAG: ABC transporter permease subunit [Clostridia bacterium]|nr:ABC transporter permease subunit [Clostridia bacterium]